MSKLIRSTVNGIVIFLLLGLVVGCSSGQKKAPLGGHARAEKTLPVVQPPTDDMQPRREFTTPTSLSGLPGASEFGLCDRIHFDYDKSAIKPEWETCLKNIARYFKENTKFTLLVEGHCDERGTEEYNIALGERRAQSVLQFLINEGLSAERIVTKSWGESKPMANGHDESAWKLNRRDEFYGVEEAR